MKAFVLERYGKKRALRSAETPTPEPRDDEVLVQVIKESIGTKGPTLSTYISIPGRYLVLMPGLNRVGVSRKIADEGQRRKLREIMNELNPPKGLGFIVRTAGLDRSKRDLARDLAYLLRLCPLAGRADAEAAGRSVFDVERAIARMQLAPDESRIAAHPRIGQYLAVRHCHLDRLSGRSEIAQIPFEVFHLAHRAVTHGRTGCDNCR